MPWEPCLFSPVFITQHASSVSSLLITEVLKITSTFLSISVYTNESRTAIYITSHLFLQLQVFGATGNLWWQTSLISSSISECIFPAQWVYFLCYRTPTFSWFSHLSLLFLCWCGGVVAQSILLHNQSACVWIPRKATVESGVSFPFIRLGHFIKVNHVPKHSCSQCRSSLDPALPDGSPRTSVARCDLGNRYKIQIQIAKWHLGLRTGVRSEVFI